MDVFLFPAVTTNNKSNAWCELGSAAAADPMVARHVAPNSAPAAIETTSGFMESLESLTQFDRQTHKTHTHTQQRRGRPALASSKGASTAGIDGKRQAPG